MQCVLRRRNECFSDKVMSRLKAVFCSSKCSEKADKSISISKQAKLLSRGLFVGWLSEVLQAPVKGTEKEGTAYTCAYIPSKVAAKHF